MKQKIFLFLILVLFILVSFSETTATTLFNFKKYADEHIVSQVGQGYFNKNLEYLGDKPYPEDVLDSNIRAVRYAHKITVDDYSQDVGVTVWFNLKNGIWEIGNGYGTKAEGLPNCIADNTKCMPFQITMGRAIEIAKNGGAFDDADKYTAKIHFFYGKVNAYIWDITTYRSAMNGKTAIIDLNTGDLLVPVADWQISFAKPEYKDAVSLTGGYTTPVPEGPITPEGSITIDFIVTSDNGVCLGDYIVSSDGKKCVRVVPPTPIIEPGVVPTETSSGTGSRIPPVDGICPERYVLSSDGTRCMKPYVPTVSIPPQEAGHEVVFTPDSVVVKDVRTGEETIIAPSEGLRTVISVSTEESVTDLSVTKNVTVEWEPAFQRTIIQVGSTVASTKESLEVKEDRMYVKDQEIKIMPDVASQIAIEKLGDVGFEIEIKDVGRRDAPQPVYEVVARTEVKILGLFRVSMKTMTQIDTQTGEASEIKKPWWSFLVR